MLYSVTHSCVKYDKISKCVLVALGLWFRSERSSRSIDVAATKLKLPT